MTIFTEILFQQLSLKANVKYVKCAFIFIKTSLRQNTYSLDFASFSKIVVQFISLLLARNITVFSFHLLLRGMFEVIK